MTRDEVFNQLAARGVAKATIHYSGGNDEGGVDDDIDLFDANGNTVAKLREENGGKWVGAEYVPDPKSADGELAEALCEPIYDQYGGFSGEFHVSGAITWDVASRTVKDSSTYGEMNYSDSEKEL